jgi:hypothetical protein
MRKGRKGERRIPVFHLSPLPQSLDNSLKIHDHDNGPTSNLAPSLSHSLHPISFHLISLLPQQATTMVDYSSKTAASMETMKK